METQVHGRCRARGRWSHWHEVASVRRLYGVLVAVPRRLAAWRPTAAKLHTQSEIVIHLASERGTGPHSELCSRLSSSRGRRKSALCGWPEASGTCYKGSRPALKRSISQRSTLKKVCSPPSQEFCSPGEPAQLTSSLDSTRHPPGVVPNRLLLFLL